ncbi:MAG TPA: non-ribosomal peptide synthetase [Legionella sp.]|nr:non-ribosomal peptide synthetase [Legionella sp.]
MKLIDFNNKDLEWDLVAVENSHHKLTYKTLARLIDYLESQVVSFASVKSRPFVLLFNNNIEYVATFLAVTRLGPVMPMNSNLPADIMADIVKPLAPSLIIHDPLNATIAKELGNKIGVETHAVALETALDQSEEYERNNDLSHYPAENDTALILHTSGTTATPKCVPLSYKNLQESIKNIVLTLELKKGDRNLNMMPLFHIHGIVASMLSTLASGGTLILKDIDYTKIADYLSLDKPNWYTAVPTIHHKIYHTLSSRPKPLKHALRFVRSCSSSLSEVLQQKTQELFKVPIVQAYGMTEAAHQVATNPISLTKTRVNSVGTTNNFVSVRIIGDDSRILNTREVGEVCIQGSNVFEGYMNNPKANKESFIDGYFKTGDLGYLDEEGFLFLTGRKKEIINKGGFKISPLQIDQIILKHPQIKEAITFPVPHETLGDDIGLMIVGDKQLNEQMIYEFIGNKLPEYMLPTKIYFVDEIPKSATGKINRLSIAKQLTPAKQASRLPQSQLEKDLAQVWQKLLMVPNVYLDDNFFQLGGNSLVAAEFYNHVANQYQVFLNPIQLYQSPTISKMGEIIEACQKNGEEDWLTGVELILKKYEDQL